METLPGGDVRQSQPLKVERVFFRETAGHPPLGWHHPPRRQYLLMLEGEMEIETSDGSKRKIGTGQILLAEDTAGKGHLTRPADRTVAVALQLE